MKKIKMNDIREMIKSNKEIEDYGITVKPYASLDDKMRIRYAVVNKAIVQYGDITRVDYILKDMHEGMLMVDVYSNIDFSELDALDNMTEYNLKYSEIYNELDEAGIVDYVCDKLKQVNVNEYIKITNLIENEVAQQEQINMSAFSAMVGGIATLTETFSGVADIAGESIRKEMATDKKSEEKNDEPVAKKESTTEDKVVDIKDKDKK